MGDRICIMNEGKVVQIGRPLEVYRNPADTFVARFLGNPPMNLLQGRLERAGRPRRRARWPAALVDLPMRTAPALGRHVGRDVIVGVRPEDLYEAAPPGDPAQFARLPARVVAVEPLGAETLAGGVARRLERGADRAHRARHGACAGATGSTSRSIPRAIHLFDPATTRAIV